MFQHSPSSGGNCGRSVTQLASMHSLTLRSYWSRYFSYSLVRGRAVAGEGGSPARVRAGPLYLAASGLAGEAGLGSHSSDCSELRIAEMSYMGDHWFCRMSRQIEPSA